ncbi:M50 family metallopeptidase [Propionibacteriaceae bacterium G1746]
MASIALHEVGHLVPAKIFGVKVTKYFVGFGKTLWATRRGETEYGFKAIPLGGYVRLVGMYPPQGARTGKEGPVTRLADAAREVEYEEITPADDGRLFHQKKTWQKLIIMFGGPAMNILLAFLIIGSVNALHGQYRPQLTIAAVSECIVPAARAEQTCQPGDPQTPAAKMGLKAGDTIVSFNGTPISNWTNFSDLIRDNRDQPATVVVLREGAQVTLPTVNTVITGVPDRLNPSRTIEAGFMGVSPDYARERTGPVGTTQDIWLMTKQSVVGLANFPVKVWNVAADMVTGKPRDVNGPMSIVGASRTAGEIVAEDSIPANDRAASWFMMLGSVNLFVALLNLVPLMPLDGGHMAGAIWEGIRRWFAKLRGRPDPGHVDTAKMLPVAYAVGAFLVSSGAVLIIADVVSPIKLF